MRASSGYSGVNIDRRPSFKPESKTDNVFGFVVIAFIVGVCAGIAFTVLFIK